MNLKTCIPRVESDPPHPNLMPTNRVLEDTWARDLGAFPSGSSREEDLQDPQQAGEAGSDIASAPSSQSPLPGSRRPQLTPRSLPPLQPVLQDLNGHSLEPGVVSPRPLKQSCSLPAAAPIVLLPWPAKTWIQPQSKHRHRTWTCPSSASSPVPPEARLQDHENLSIPFWGATILGCLTLHPGNLAAPPWKNKCSVG